MSASTDPHALPPLSRDAVTTMLHGHRSVPFPTTTPLIVRVTTRSQESDPDWDDDDTQRDRSRAVWVEDATSRVRGLLVGSARTPLERSPSPSTVLVKGYVTCEVNPGNPRPLLFLAEVSILSRPWQPSRESRRQEQQQQHHIPSKPLATLPPSRVPGGTMFEFLERTAPLLLNRWQLAEAVDCGVVTRFMEHVRAVETLQSASWGAPAPLLTMSTTSSSSTASTSSSSPREQGGGGEAGADDDATNNNNQSAFASALAEFEQSQLDRQAATLASHASRNPEHAATVVSQHRDAVQAATNYGAAVRATSIGGGGSPLTVGVLCRWHQQACDNVISSPGGQIRTRAVRVGNVSFRPASEARSDLAKVCAGLSALESRLLNSADAIAAAGAMRMDGSGAGARWSLGSRAALYSSIVFFAIADTHAFADGNGRLARIASNYALRRCGFPVPIALFVTPSQRKEYTQATVETRRNLYLLARGEVAPDTLLEAYSVAGAFTPVLKLFLDRMEKAVGELTKLVHDKQRMVQEEVHHQEARLFRERAAQGMCLICFDEAPNITTLCCGKAVHLNCMAEWLTTNATCPNCRAAFPSLPQRITQRPVVEDNDEDDEEGVTTTSDDDDDEDDNSDTMNDQDASTTSDPVASRVAQIVANAAMRAGALRAGTEETSDDDNTTTDDDDNNVRSNQQSGGGSAAAMSTDDTTTVDDDERCLYCSNKAARDCQNRLCGRCCQLSGQFQCSRHGCFGT